MPNDSHKLDEMDVLRHKMEQELNETLNHDIEHELEVFKLSKKLYKACMDLGKLFKTFPLSLNLLVFTIKIQ